MLVSYNWLKEYLCDATPTPEEVERLLTFHSFEIEGVEEKSGDFVIDVDVLPNRSSDCLSHRGIAREIATLIGTPLVNDPLNELPEFQKTDSITVDIEDSMACPRFTASLITDVTVKESPQWLKDRLSTLGQRSVNNIVDATNYVMFALGQPLHAYDAEKFPKENGKWRFSVRYAKEGEVISLLTEGGKDEDRDVILTGSELLIVDASSDTPIGLAGVKGGRFAEVDETTTKIIVEGANFAPDLTRKTARRLGIVIDASKRFENNLSRELPPYAQNDIIKLITDIAGGTCAGVLDEYLKKQKEVEVCVSPERTNALLGLSLSHEEMITILKRVGVSVTEEKDILRCVGPFERIDLTIEEDIIEEIGRVYGYEHVESVVPEPVPLSELNTRHYYSEQIRHVLLPFGFSEVITSSFRKKDDVSLRNALASDKGCLRSSLKKNISDVLERNISHADLLGVDDIRVFEIGTVFQKGGERGVAEHVALTLGVRKKQSGYTPKDDSILQEAITALEGSFGTSFSFEIAQGVAESNFSKVLEGLPSPEMYEQIERGEDVTYEPFSAYPAIARDIALWVNEGTEAEEVAQVLNDAAGALRVGTRLFDTFTKEGRTSYAFRLVFQAMDRTLTDDEINQVMEGVYKAAEAKDWEVR